MKQIKISKYMKERANQIVNALCGTNLANNNNAIALAKALETPSVHKVDNERYSVVLTATLNDIRDGAVIDLLKHSELLESCVIKGKRVLSPEIRQSRYEKAKAKLMEKYGIEG